MKLDKYVLVLVASLALLLAGCGGGSSTTTTPPPDPGPTAGETAIMNAKQALSTAQTAVGSATTDQGRLDAQQGVVQAASNLIDVLTANGGSAADIRAASNALADARNAIATLTSAIDKADMAMIAMAAKLRTAIGTTPLASNGTGTAIAAATGVLTVQKGSTTATQLKENKDAMVAPLHGWVGSEHTATVATGDNAGTYTAHLYSNVGEPAQGAKFNSGTGTGNVGFALDTNGALADTTTFGTDSAAAFAAGHADKVASPQFDHSAGSKAFKLPDPNPNGETKINIPGSYYGVAGTYTCTPGDDACTATKASGAGYTLAGGGAWIFTPDNPDDRVTDMPDTMYAVYGWWLHEVAGGTATVSAFTALKGSVPGATGLGDLNGTATYRGGAAGKYSIVAGATNDGGHFTADAELMANFSDNTITGTIDNFMGSDGMSRDWSVALKKSGVNATGSITDSASGAGDGNQKTTWTMGGTAADDSGAWSGTLYDNNDAGVPQVGTGTFHSEYGKFGRMVGAFGVDLEN